jgi:FMN phosphatase YigB (HAD superfamily)
MTNQPIHRLVVDAHGVVLNAPFPAFLRTVAEETGQQPAEVGRRWREELRIPAWTGQIDDAQLWKSLAGDQTPARSASEWQALLEATFAPGPAAPRLAAWSEQVPIWMLANHRSHWLIPRLKRFGLHQYFERVLVSDELGAAKPAPRAFELLLGTTIDAKHTLYVDDQAQNVESALELGLQALLLDEGPDSLARVEQRLSGV